MKVNMSARLYHTIVLTNRKIEANILAITNDGDTPVEFQPESSSNKSEKSFIGIDFEILYGNNGTDLVSKDDIKKISIVSRTKDVDVIKITNRISEDSGKIIWRIYPLKNVVIEPQEPIIIKLYSVKTNNSAGTVKIPMCICSDDDRKLFYVYLKKNDPPKITKFSAEAVRQTINGFISLEAAENEENEYFILQPYMGPDAPSPSPSPHPPAGGNEFLVKWECENSFSCELSYGNSNIKISSSGEKYFDIDKNIKTIKLTAYGENKVGFDEKVIILQN